ncbi:MAG: ubiquinol-cytochrome c reductase iron-sulfur subunit [Acidobacteria bacterium]|nr:ubiquinol-cytochrome c reductase iron-sulfur subunit [Acidobacteriota bacterium]MBI3655610.1 ubiquinol-cytochrome c reductase iron-sulfur subunit [Acidobacteriota bacterium]
MEVVSKRTDRRSFLNYLLGTGIGAAVVSFFYPVIKFLIPPRIAEAPTSSVVAAKVGEVAPNTGKVFRFGSKPGILINGPDGSLRAYSATCTHLDCIVQYRPDMQNIWCACHNGRYDLNGLNIAGPPPRPLEVYDVRTRSGEIVVSKKGG